MIRSCILLLICLMLSSACAPRVSMETTDPGVSLWSSLVPKTSPEEQILAQFSLHVASPRRSGRLLGQIWGRPDSLIRLDLSSSTGGVMAMIRETPFLWAAYIPSEQHAYHHDEALVGLSFFQIPVPFTARQISSLISGDLSAILTALYTKENHLSGGRIQYVFNQGDVASLVLSARGRVLTLYGKNGWTLTCERPYDLAAFSGRNLYEKFTFESPRDGKAVLRIKSLDHGRNWQTADLDLRPPQDTIWTQLETGDLNNSSPNGEL